MATLTVSRTSSRVAVGDGSAVLGDGEAEASSLVGLGDGLSSTGPGVASTDGEAASVGEAAGDGLLSSATAGAAVISEPARHVAKISNVGEARCTS
jgi:hypothetical protein